MTTDSDQQTGTWLSLHDGGFSKYESSDDGYGPDQRPVRRAGGQPLKPRVGTHGYLEVKLYNDQGKQQTRTVHSLVMLPRVGPCPPGMQTRHYDDDPFNNRWRPGGEAESVAAGGNLFYGDRPEQEEDKYRNGRPRPAPRPVRYCVLCDSVLTTNGKRCHDCVVRLGEQAAGLLRGGHDPDDVAAALGYPSAEGIVKLAVVHGGYGRPRLKWLHKVTTTVRNIFHGTGRGHGK
jgi:hypothetical protein